MIMSQSSERLLLAVKETMKRFLHVDAGPEFVRTQIGMFGWLVALVGLVFVFFLAPEASLGNQRILDTEFSTPAQAFANVLQGLPTQLRFYLTLAMAVFLYIAVRNRQYYLLLKQAGQMRKEWSGDLSDNDWWVAQDLCKRSFKLRSRAGLVLGSVWGLLFSGIYLSLYVLPVIVGNDPYLIFQSRFQGEFRAILDGLAEGRYWIQVDQESIPVPNDDSSESRFRVQNNTMLSVLTSDDGENWTPFELPLNTTDEITAAAFSANGRVGLIAGDKGSIYRTTDGGEKWSAVNVSVRENEWIRSAAFSVDGRVGIITGDEGSVSRTTDGGEKWSPANVSLKENEWAFSAALSGDGRVGVIAGDEGSVFRTTDGGEKWSPVNVSLKESEWIRSAALSGDGRVGVIAGDEGSVFRTTDGGEKWSPVNVLLKESEWIRSAALSGDGRVGTIAGDKGSIYRTTDSGEQWFLLTSLHKQFSEYLAGTVRQERPDNWISLLNSLEVSVEARVSQAGQNWILTDGFGLVLRKQAGEKTWLPIDQVFQKKEFIPVAGVSDDNQVGIIVGNRGSIFRTSNGGQQWSTVDLWRGEGGWTYEADFGKDIRVGIVFSNRGSVYRTVDHGENWARTNLSLQPNESVRIAALSDDDQIGIIVGDKGSILRTMDSAASWASTNLILERIEQITGPIVTKLSSPRRQETSDQTSGDIEQGVSPNNANEQEPQLEWKILAMTSDGKHYVLSPYYELSRWRELSLQGVYGILMNNDVLSESEVGREVRRYIDDAPLAIPGLVSTRGSEEPSVESVFGLEQLTVTRIAVLTILFFLAQILVRVYQYNLRLAAFWQARADAMLIAKSFSDSKDKAISFDDLVSAMAPDAQDFKASAKSPIDWVRFRKKP